MFRSFVLMLAIALLAGSPLFAANDKDKKDEDVVKDYKKFLEEFNSLKAFLKKKEIDIQTTDNKSNVIALMVTVGPNHDKKYTVGLNYSPKLLTGEEVFRKAPLAIPFEVHGHWTIWQVGGPGGNATDDYKEVWTKVRKAVKEYAESKKAKD